MAKLINDDILISKDLFFFFHYIPYYCIVSRQCCLQAQINEDLANHSCFATEATSEAKSQRKSLVVGFGLDA